MLVLAHPPSSCAAPAAAACLSGVPLPAGADEAVAATVARMYALAAEAAPDLRALAPGLVRGLSPERAVERLFSFVAARVRYRSDDAVLAAWGLPGGRELLMHPLVTLEHGAADCANQSVLLLALLIASGLPVSATLRTAATAPAYPTAWNHVYLRASIAGSPVLALDPAYGPYVGWEVEPGATMRDGSRVGLANRKKDWAMNLGNVWTDTITQTVIPSALEIAKRRYGNPPQGTYRAQAGPDGSQLVESFGGLAFPNNLTTGGGNTLLLVGGLLVGGVLLASLLRSAGGRGRR